MAGVALGDIDRHFAWRAWRLATSTLTLHGLALVARLGLRLAPLSPETQACHQSQSSAISATPAMQSDGRGHQAPRLTRKVKVDVTKCHACHANSRSDNGAKRRPKRATRARPCKVRVDVAKRHARHAK